MNSSLLRRQFLGSFFLLPRSTFQAKRFSSIGLDQTSVGHSCFYSSKFRVKVISQGEASMSTSSISKGELDLKDCYKPRNIQFKNPYGSTACLEWGNPNAPHKVLCMHGWLDNAGSFERLIPYILDHGDNAEKYYILAMDQPGVGLSSHLPSGTFYTQYSAIIEMRRIVRELKWDKMTLLSHSLGAHLSFMYSCIYPQQVESVLSIDLAHPLAVQARNWHITISNSIEEHFKYEKDHEDDPATNINVRVYSETEAVKRLMDSHSNSLTRESAEVLLKRGAKKQRWGYTFSRDLRLRYLSIENRLTDELMLEYMSEPFRPNLFIIRANRSPYHRPESLRLKYYELFAKNCPLFREVVLDGTHHLHMNTPELVAPEINKFLDEIRAGSTAEQTKTQKSNL